MSPGLCESMQLALIRSLLASSFSCEATVVHCLKAFILSHRRTCELLFGALRLNSEQSLEFCLGWNSEGKHLQKIVNLVYFSSRVHICLSHLLSM